MGSQLKNIGKTSKKAEGFSQFLYYLSNKKMRGVLMKEDIIKKIKEYKLF